MQSLPPPEAERYLPGIAVHVFVTLHISLEEPFWLEAIRLVPNLGIMQELPEKCMRVEKQ